MRYVNIVRRRREAGEKRVARCRPAPRKVHAQCMPHVLYRRHAGPQRQATQIMGNSRSGAQNQNRQNACAQRAEAADNAEEEAAWHEEARVRQRPRGCACMTRSGATAQKSGEASAQNAR